MPANASANNSSKPLLAVRGLTVRFQAARGERTTAVNNVSFELRRGETLAIVGESGGGKTSLLRAILRLIPADAGTIEFDGVDVTTLRGAALRRWRRRAQIVFQDPRSSLNPVMRVVDLVGEALRVHGLVRTKAEQRERVAALLQSVGLPTAALDRYPHEFSGGQRQRIGIARALALDPELLILDEPVAALDVSIQSQILNLLLELQASRGLSYLFIAHDLAVVRHVCTRVLVLKRGEIVEQGETERVFSQPEQAYTQALVAAAAVRLPACRGA